MNTDRRTILHAGAAAALALTSGHAVAQAPGPIRMVVPFGAGTTTDIVSREVAQALATVLGQGVVVDNKAGAGGTIGAQQVAKSPADGQTVLFTIVALVQQMSLMNLPYDPLKDFVPITRVAISPSILAVPKETPANNLKEFVALVKSQPGKFS